MADPNNPRQDPLADTRPTFSARPVCAAGRSSRSTQGPYATHYTAVASWLYITRQRGEDRFGPVPDQYMAKDDLISTGRYHPLQKVAPELREGRLIWDEADSAAARGGDTEIAATHIVASLPPAPPERWADLIRTYCLQNLVELGMVVD